MVRILLLFILMVSNGFAAGNYKSVKGLELKEATLEEENTKEITIQKREVVKRTDIPKDYSSKKFLNSGYFCDEKEMCRYISFSFFSAVKNKVSDKFALKNELNFATPIADKRFGGDVFFGGKPFPSNHIDLLFGVSYDLAYFDGIYDPKSNPEAKVKEYGMHAIAPSVRMLVDFFPQEKFSFYLGGEFGLAIVDFVQGENYSVKYSYKTVGFSQIGYKFGAHNNFEVFVGYRIFYVPELTFDLGKEKIKTQFSGQTLQSGIKIKF